MEPNPNIEELRERLKTRLKLIPAKDRQKFFSDKLIEVSSTKTDTDKIEIDRSELDKMMCVEAVIIQAIAAKNKISCDRMLYDLSTSYYANVDTTDKNFKFPSDQASENVESLIETGKESEYQKNIPIDIQINESEQNSFRDKILESFENKQDKLINLLKQNRK